MIDLEGISGAGRVHTGVALSSISLRYVKGAKISVWKCKIRPLMFEVVRE